jgi:hypothetical protein
MLPEFAPLQRVADPAVVPATVAGSMVIEAMEEFAGAQPPF